jgi:hypothetical protein
METPFVKSVGNVVRLESYIAPNQIARNLFQRMYYFARPILEAFAGDLMIDAQRLIEFEQRATLQMALQNRDWFAHTGRVNWMVRPTGTEYGDDKQNLNTIRKNEHPLRVQWSFSCNEDCRRLDLWQVVYDCPPEWVQRSCACGEPCEDNSEFCDKCWHGICS